jgi:hypothetical protein
MNDERTPAAIGRSLKVREAFDFLFDYFARNDYRFPQLEGRRG